MEQKNREGRAREGDELEEKDKEELVVRKYRRREGETG